MKRPAAVFGFAALFTVIAVMLFSDTAAYVIIAAAGIPCAVFGALRKKHFVSVLLTVCLASCISFLSYKAAYELKYLPDSTFNERTCTLVGTAADYPYASGDCTSVKLKDLSANGTKLNGGAVFYGKELPRILPGDTVTVKKATLRGVDKNDAFFMHSLSSNEYFTVFNGDLSASPGERKGLTFGILSLRHAVSNRLRISLSAAAFPVADALITGNQSVFTADFSRGLRIAGASHIFAVSGMHLSVWTVILFFVLTSLIGTRRINSVIGIVFILFFIVFTGKSPSVIRAGIMLTVAFAGSALRLPPDPMNSLGLASAFCVIANPFLAGNVSFLLSTAATAAVITAGIISSSHFIDIKIMLIKNIAVAFVDAFTISAVVTVFTLPISAFFFGSASLLSGLSTVLCTLPAETVMVFGVAGTILFGTDFVGGLAFYICEKAARLILAITDKLSELDCFIVPLNIKYAVIISICILTAATVAASFAPVPRTAAVACSTFCVCAALSAMLIYGSLLTPKTTVYIPGGKNCDIVITENNGECTAVLGMSGSFSSLTSVKRELTKCGRTNADLLILSGGITDRQKLISSYAPDTVLFADGSSTLFEDGTTVTSATFSMSDTTTLTYTNRDGFSGCLLKTADKTVAFVFSGKTHDLPDEYLATDVTVFKYGIPENAKDSSSRKITLSVETDDSISALNTNAVVITAAGGIKNGSDK